MKTTIEGLGCMGMRLLDMQEEMRRVVDNPVFRGMPSRVTVELANPSTLSAVLRIGDETWLLECHQADNPDNHETWRASYDKRGCFLGEASRGNQRCWKIFDEAEADYDKQAEAEDASIEAAIAKWETE